MKKLALIAVVMLVAGPALADFGTVELKQTAVSPRLTGKIWAPHFENGIGNVLVGLYHFDLRNPNLDPDAPFKFHDIETTGFCIEMRQSNSSYKTFSIVDLSQAPQIHGPSGNPMGATKADYLRELWDKYYDTIDGNSTRAAAFQASVWEIVYEDAEPWNVSSWYNDTDPNNDLHANSSFKLTNFNSTAANLANGWLWSLEGIGGKTPLVGLTSDGYQDYLVKVPAPAAVGLGLVGLGLLGRRMRRYA